MNTPVVYHREYFSDIGLHVFPTEKFAMIYETLEQEVEDFESSVQRPVPLTRAQLMRVHTPEYLHDLDTLQYTSRTAPSELPISRQIVDAYYLMAGGTCLAARLALEHGCAINLGGGFHHAFADRAEGFCYVNDVALGVREVLAGQNAHRAAIIDTDLHQGNGTASIFTHDPEVFTFSIHQQNNYPAKQRSDLDIGLADGTGDAEYLESLNRALDHIFTQFEPGFVLYVGGVDPYREDQLGGLDLTKEGIKKRDRTVFEHCRRHHTPVAAVLAGGYARDVRDTVEMHINTYRAMRAVFS